MSLSPPDTGKPGMDAVLTPFESSLVAARRKQNQI